MKQIPSHIKTLYDAHLKNKAIPKGIHFHYLKWLRYYLDYCEEYCLEPLREENVVSFIQKLKTKKQTVQQQKQAYHAVSLFYELSVRSEKQKALEIIDDKIARKKDSGVLMRATPATQAIRMT